MPNTSHATSTRALTPATARALDDDALRALAVATNIRVARAHAPLPAGINAGLREQHRAHQRSAIPALAGECSILHAELARRGMRRGGDRPAGASQTSDACTRWDFTGPWPAPASATLEVVR